LGKLDYQLLLAKKYFFESGGNIEHLVSLLEKSYIPLTDGTRQFIADVFSGKIKPKNNKAKKLYFRDLKIYKAILITLRNGTNLTSSRDRSGAAYFVAKGFNISEEAAVKIFQRMHRNKTTIKSLEDYL
jgi:hypothetical protein